MDMFFADPSEVPLPPDEVRILDFRIEPYPDGRRMRVYLEITPFQVKPSGDIVISDSTGDPVAISSFVEAITPRNEMTLHLRSFDPGGNYSAVLTLFYSFEVEDGAQDDRILVRPEKQVVDEAKISFQVNQDDRTNPEIEP